MAVPAGGPSRAVCIWALVWATFAESHRFASRGDPKAEAGAFRHQLASPMSPRCDAKEADQHANLSVESQ